MKQDKADKIIKKAELKAQKAAQQVQVASKKAEITRQRQVAQAQKKAAKAADAATKKAAKKTKKAELAAKKAQLAAKKAEEKKAKAVAKAAAKAAENTGKGEEGGAAAPKKKKSKKKLLLIAIPVLAVAIGAGAFFFLKGGGEEEAEAEQAPVPPPGEYLISETHVSALPVWGEALVYLDEVEPETPEESEGGEAEGDQAEGGEAEAAGEEEGFHPFIYRYENLQNPSGLVSAYTALMTSEDAGFSVVDETLLRIDPPEEFGVSGTVQLARNVPKAEDGTGGGVHSLLLKWIGTTCTVTVDMPEGVVHDPKPETAAPAAPRRGLSDIEALHPSKLGLPGDSMEEYELMPQEGSVLIAGNPSPCMRINIYDQSNQIAGSYFLSGDGRLYKLDEEANAVVELDWE